MLMDRMRNPYRRTFGVLSTEELMLMDRMRNPYQLTFGGVVYGSAHADGFLPC